MHADELNKPATEECGHPVYHYHLHVVAIPVVEKVERYSARYRDKEKVGTVKGIIRQVSHSKKWASTVQAVDDDGNPVLRPNGKPKFIRSYSLLQDELYDHMTEAGFKDFERGERGSTAEHLSSLQYQYRKDLERSAELDKEIRLKTVQYETADGVYRTVSGIDSMGQKRSLTGKCLVDPEELDALKGLAKEGITSRSRIEKLSDSVSFYSRQFYEYREAFERVTAKYEELKEQCRPYLEALRAFPDKVKSFLDELLSPVRAAQESKKQLRRSKNEKQRTR